MAGGPIFPHSVYLGGASGRLFPNFYAGGGGNASAHDEGIGVIASLSGGAPATAELRFQIPPSVPTGTMKLNIFSLANATTGGGVLNVSAACVNASSSPSAATLVSQATASVQWNTGNADQYINTKITFATITPQLNQVLVVALNFQSGGGTNNEAWTLAQTSTWITPLIWE